MKVQLPSERFKGQVNYSRLSRVMDESSEEEDRDKLKCAAVTSYDLFSTPQPELNSREGTRDFLARKLQQWLDR